MIVPGRSLSDDGLSGTSSNPKRTLVGVQQRFNFAP